MKRGLFTQLVLLGLVAKASAVTFLSTELDLNVLSGSFSKEGLQVTLTANQGVVNATASTGLGINSPTSADETAQLDNDAGIEILSIAFDQDVLFRSLEISSAGTGDQLDLSFSGGLVQVLDSTGVHAFDQFLAAGNVLTISTENLTGNGVAIQNFVVDIVPEPSSAFLCLLGGLSLFRRKR